jgi:ABC-type sugar transport system permease subunit
MYIYQWAFEFSKMGYASTLGVVFALIIFAVVLIERRILDREPVF